MRTLAAAGRGMARALGSPKLVLWLWAVNLLAALPAAIVIEEAVHRELGAGRMEEGLAEGFDMAWYGEYRHRARGLEQSFTPTHSGPGAFFANLDSWLRGDLLEQPPALAAMGIGYALLWTLLLGGILDRWLRPAAGLDLGGFLGASGRYGFRLLRLAVLTVALYAGVYWLARRLFPWLERLTDQVTAETPVLAAYLAGAAAIALLLTFVRLASDQAKIALVSERRRSSLAALIGGAGFVVAHPLRTFATAALFAVAGAAALGLYAVVAPGAGASRPWALAGAVAVSQLYLVVKLVLRLGFLSAELALAEDAGRDTLPPPL